MTTIEELPRLSPEVAAAQIRSRALAMKSMGAPLYANVADRMVDDPEILAMASKGLGLLPEVHLFVAVQYLLMRDPQDPLAHYYANLTDTPAPPEEAFPEFRRFCLRNREKILHLFRTRTIQATMPARCQATMALLSFVADRAGEPLDLIEIGCSAGLLLAFDQFAYDVKGRGGVGPKNAPMTLGFTVHGGPDLRIPKIGKRVGLDLRPVDVRQEDERRWLLAQFPPEMREEREKLSIALDVVANTPIEYVEGDALELLPRAIAASHGPLCVYHANCVCYWSDESTARLESLLLDASRGREIYRVSMEPDLQKTAREGRNTPYDYIITRYCDGVADRQIVVQAAPDNGTLTWRD